MINTEVKYVFSGKCFRLMAAVTIHPGIGKTEKTHPKVGLKSADLATPELLCTNRMCVIACAASRGSHEYQSTIMDLFFYKK